MAKKSLAPRQERSRESERKLLQAAFRLLAQHGLEGTTIARVAAEAGLTPGAVYRRFPDKTALLEAVLVTVLENNQKRVMSTLTPAMARQQPLPELLGTLIDSMIKGYRTHAGVLRSLRQLAHTSEHQAIRKKVVSTEKQTLEYTIEVLLRAYGAEICHPQPALALSLGFSMLTYTLIELFLVDSQLDYWPPFVPKDDGELCQELTRTFLRQLGHTDA